MLPTLGLHSLDTVIHNYRKSFLCVCSKHGNDHRRRQDFLPGWAKIEAPSGKRRRREVEAPQAMRGERSGEEYHPPQPTRRSGERRELPQRGPGRSPGHKRVFGIF